MRPNRTSGTEPIALILGGGMNGLGAVRSFARAGVRSIVVNPYRDEATASRYCRHFQVQTFEGEAFVAEMVKLRATLRRDAVLICADDRPLMTLSKFRDFLMNYFLFDLPPHDLLEKFTCKIPFFLAAQQGGFCVPQTIKLGPDYKTSAFETFRLPLCIKPNSRSLAYDHNFQKAYCVTRREEAKALCDRIFTKTDEVIIQEWIEGPNDEICFVLCCLGGPNPVFFTGRKGRSWPAQVGPTASCWAATEVSEELEETTIRFFHHVGINQGLASMEFKRDSRDGRFYMVEPTIGRVDSQEEIATLCGSNLCHFAYCDAAGLARPDFKLDPTHVWRNEFTDFRAARSLGTSCSFQPGHRIHNAFWRWEDPFPAVLAASRAVKKAMHHLLYRDR